MQQHQQETSTITPLPLPHSINTPPPSYKEQDESQQASFVAPAVQALEATVHNSTNNATTGNTTMSNSSSSSSSMLLSENEARAELSVLLTGKHQPNDKEQRQPVIFTARTSCVDFSAAGARATRENDEDDSSSSNSDSDDNSNDDDGEDEEEEDLPAAAAVPPPPPPPPPGLEAFLQAVREWAGDHTATWNSNNEQRQLWRNRGGGPQNHRLQSMYSNVAAIANSNHHQLGQYRQQQQQEEEEPEKTEEELQLEQDRVVELLQMHPCLCNELFHHLYPLEYLICEYEAPLPLVQQVYHLGDPNILKYRSHRKTKRSVLHNVCHYGANHDQGNVIAFLANACPKVVSRPDDNGYAPLHLLLRDIDFHEPLESIQTLVELYPESVVTGKVPEPQHSAAKKDEEEESMMSNLVPFLVRFTSSSTSTSASKKLRGPLTPLQYALRAQYPASTLEYLFSQVPSHQTAFTLSSNWHGGAGAGFGNDQQRRQQVFVLDETAVQGLAVLLPRLQDFTCQARHWTLAGFYQLLEQIGQNKSIQHLNLVMPVALIQDQNDDVMLQRQVQRQEQVVQGNDDIPNGSETAKSTDNTSTTTTTALHFRDCFRRNNTLTHLTLEGYGPFLWPVQYAFGESLVHLSLKNFQLNSNDSHVLSDILQHKRAPPNIILQHVHLQGPYKPCNFATRKHYKCPIQRMEITLDVSPHSKWIYGLLEDLRKAANLNTLTLSRGRTITTNNNNMPAAATWLSSLGGGPHWNITKRICAILKRNRLSYLNICSGFYLEFAPIAEALAQNTSLKTYIVECHARGTAIGLGMADLLQQQNTTLGYISRTNAHVEEETTLFGPLIWYYTKLNMYGRHDIRQSTNGMSLEEFVRQLARIQQDSDIKRLVAGSSDPLWGRHGRKETMLHYGLLREMPSLWCHVVGAGASTTSAEC